jgi:rhamnosyltransferase
LEKSDVFVIDSSSSDDTPQLARQEGYNLITILKQEFSHGKTRASAIRFIDADIIVFLTQDAILAEADAIIKLVEIFRNSEIGAAYGRQIPKKNDKIYSQFIRLYNYPCVSRVNSFADHRVYGIKTAFLSDSFSAYRKQYLLGIGNFKSNLNFGEDMCAAAQLLIAGYKTAYCANACVFHSHQYSLHEEFRRSKEIGNFHRQEKNLLKIFGNAEGEGVKYVIAEMRYLWNQGKGYLIPCAIIRNSIKYIGYFIGKHGL